ncbi:MAG: hypothetical protein KC503_34310 [Myxococcales bacterium]|nr:hypothetical protein [Myxococcales bacterium]
MAKKTPLQQVKDLHGGKEKLVDKLAGMVELDGESKDDFKERLLAAPNSKLLRLHSIATEIRERFGDKAKLVDSLLGLQNKSKDVDYRDKLLTLSPTQLLSEHHAAERRAAKAAR